MNETDNSQRNKRKRRKHSRGNAAAPITVFPILIVTFGLLLLALLIYSLSACRFTYSKF